MEKKVVTDMSHSDDDNGSTSSYSAARDSSTPNDNGTSTGGSQKSPDELNVETIKLQLSKKETKAVFRLRCIFLAIKLAVAVAVTFTIYRITTKAETDQFNSQYDGVSEKIIASFTSFVDGAGSIVSVGKAATIYALDHNATWPFTTVSDFQERAATARLLSGTLFVSLLNLVTDDDRKEWQNYVEGPARVWLNQSLEFNTKMGYDNFLVQNLSSFPNVKNISYIDESGQVLVDPGPGPYLQKWMIAPAVANPNHLINQNLFRRPAFAPYVHSCVDGQHAIFGDFEYGPPGEIHSDSIETSFYATLLSIKENRQEIYLGDPMGRLYLPVYDTFEDNRTVVAVLTSIAHWRTYFTSILPTNVNGIDVILENTCGGSYTYRLNGANATVVGFGDYHNPQFDVYRKTASFDQISTINDGTYDPVSLSQDGCSFTVNVYPSSAYYETIHTNKPVALTVSMALVILTTILMFLLYNRLVEKRQQMVLSKAAQSTAIVSSLFPKQVREKMMEMQEDNNKNSGSEFKTSSNKLKAFMSSTSGGGVVPVVESQLAEFFPQCTVLFADISGFTAWSSTREPANVFVLLQTVFSGFDRIAKRRKVFKVETIGDCYVAVTGLPEPQSNHYIIMARFAWECRNEMHQMMRELEKRLGPDCSDLVMRFGLHSGPVTAGVLRGDRARFQLFGDTVNTASRMESTGIRDKIHMSQSTAELLMAADKSHWVTPRDNTIEAKGKGLMQTYWLSLSAKKATSSSANSDRGNHTDGATEETTNTSKSDIDESKQDRLVDWMLELLVERLKPMMAQRKLLNGENANARSLTYQPPAGTTCLDEFKEVIAIAGYAKEGKESLDLTDTVSTELLEDMRCYVKMIAELYRGNPFHNFEHACHVTMSVNKLLKRIIEADHMEDDVQSESSNENHAIRLHNFTHGLCNDYMASFAIVFSALIHDVDHRGCSNMQLIQEEVSLGVKYRNKSVAEQNSIDVAWNLLMDGRFDRLRKAMFGNIYEMLRFRQFIVNIVLATDIFDKELNDLRKNRWMKAFSDDACNHDADHSNRKATIVIEHIIQASDVSHTMQHWQVYRKWNKLLFHEMYLAFHQGRMKADPATFWYDGEIGFLDNYVIPLAKKLKECNVFGVSSDEYLNYAVGNRAEWASRGQNMIAEMIQEFQQSKTCY